MAQTTKVIGELAVVALKARDLPNREIVGKQDPFCVFRLGEEAKKTKTDYRGGQYPVWDDQVNLVVPEGKTKMRVQIFDEDAKKEDLISETDIDLAEVIKEGEQDGWFQLMFKGRKAGEIYLELTFYSARPPPRRQPTRYKGAYTRPQSYQQPPPPLPNNNYPPSTGRPLPPAPTASTSTPVNYSGVGPKPYIPPPAAQNQPQHIATPHMPQTLNPQPRPSTSTGYPPVSSAHPTPNPNHHSPYPPPSSHQRPPPQNNSSFYPPSSNPPPSHANGNNNNTQPLLSAPFRPGHSPQNSVSGQQNNHGYPPPSHGYNQPYPPTASSYPPSSQPQYGSFSTPITASATPYGGSSTPVPPSANTLSFPQPQRHSGSFNSPFPTPQQPFAAAQPPPSHYPPSSTGGYPPPSNSGYPPNPVGGYPPPSNGGYPPQQQHGYPPQQNQHHGYPPYPPQ